MKLRVHSYAPRFLSASHVFTREPRDAGETFDVEVREIIASGTTATKIAAFWR